MILMITGLFFIKWCDSLDLIAPVKTIMLRSKNDPWFEAELFWMWKQKSRLYNLSRKNKIHHSNFDRLRNAFISLLWPKKAEYFKSFANDLGYLSQKFWSTISPYPSPNKNTKTIPLICSCDTTYCTASEIAKFFAEFFLKLSLPLLLLTLTFVFSFVRHISRISNLPRSPATHHHSPSPRQHWSRSSTPWKNFSVQQWKNTFDSQLRFCITAQLPLRHGC